MGGVGEGGSSQRNAHVRSDARTGRVVSHEYGRADPGAVLLEGRLLDDRRRGA